MATESQQKWTLTHQLVNEAVGAAMESSFREPILEAVEDAGDVSVQGSESENTTSSSLTKALQGLAVFVVMFVVLYVLLRRLTDDGE